MWRHSGESPASRQTVFLQCLGRAPAAPSMSRAPLAPGLFRTQPRSAGPVAGAPWLALLDLEPFEASPFFFSPEGPGRAPVPARCPTEGFGAPGRTGRQPGTDDRSLPLPPLPPTSRMPPRGGTLSSDLSQAPLPSRRRASFTLWTPFSLPEANYILLLSCQSACCASPLRPSPPACVLLLSPKKPP